MRNYQHSSSICYHRNNLYLAYYDGPEEGWEQKAKVLKHDKHSNRWKTIKTFGYGTGNPVIFSWNNRLFLALTIFRNEVKGIENLSVLWANTDMVLFSYNDSQKEWRPIAWHPYCACRCAPLICKNKLLLPCYDETRREGIVFSLGNYPDVTLTRYAVISSNKHPLIQPTLFIKNNHLFFYARNFSNAGEHNYKAFEGKCKTSTEDDILKCLVKKSIIPNHNESLLVIPYNKSTLLIYNAGASRRKLVTTEISAGAKPKILAELTGKETEFGSYPNYCIDNTGNLMICFTGYNSKEYDTRKIRLKTFNKNMGLIWKNTPAP
jgi:hypothetical protein